MVSKSWITLSRITIFQKAVCLSQTVCDKQQRMCSSLFPFQRLTLDAIPPWSKASDLISFLFHLWHKWNEPLEKGHKGLDLLLSVTKRVQWGNNLPYLFWRTKPQPNVTFWATLFSDDDKNMASLKAHLICVRNEKETTEEEKALFLYKAISRNTNV